VAAEAFPVAAVPWSAEGDAHLAAAEVYLVAVAPDPLERVALRLEAEHDPVEGERPPAAAAWQRAHPPVGAVATGPVVVERHPAVQKLPVGIPFFRVVAIETVFSCCRPAVAKTAPSWIQMEVLKSFQLLRVPENRTADCFANPYALFPQRKTGLAGRAPGYSFPPHGESPNL
jgi:hypothetical protein